ncbi:host attachment family protein [Propylenella binzhouense]|uniref:Host attachment protein n=1 Tax=Propylenella binzhouense TaxID=2555902 RepID=A0A964T7N2_9HYPH|nr:host attachment family protein [Propylenella binzhouense]MYZ50008.1 host attachment protein [Propylenella binzhouense]
MAKVTIRNGDWILVGDGVKAMLFRNAGDPEHLDLRVLDLFEHETPPTREQGTDRPGRVHQSAATARSAVEETDWHRFEKERFAKDLADTLYRKAHAGAFERLVVVAPPPTLGDLRKAFHQEVSARIVAEIDKTLTNHPVGKIESLLAMD